MLIGLILIMCYLLAPNVFKGEICEASVTRPVFADRNVERGKSSSLSVQSENKCLFIVHTSVCSVY